jgi:subtilisin family serine protease
MGLYTDQGTITFLSTYYGGRGGMPMASILDLLLTGLFLDNKTRKNDYPQRQIIVFKSGYKPSAATVAELGGKVLKEIPLINGIACTITEPISPRLLARHEEILRIDEDLPISIVTGRNFSFPLFLFLLLFLKPSIRSRKNGGDEIPWGVKMVRAPEIWPLTRGEGVKVAVIDTGVDLDHPDLAANLRQGINILDGERPPQDHNGHGTHVAGTIGAVENGRNPVGVSPGVEIYPIKALNDKGNGWLSDIIAGVEWCINNGMHIINMSFVVNGNNESLREMILATDRAGVLVVAAAGNSGPGENTVQFPARYPETIAVSAVDRKQQIAGFSSRGPEVDLTAPGVEILSLWPGGGKKKMQGTSMAAPHVTGVAALLLSVDRTASPAVVKKILLESARPLPDLKKSEQGAGLVDARAVLKAPVSLPPAGK